MAALAAIDQRRPAAEQPVLPPLPPPLPLPLPAALPQQHSTGLSACPPNHGRLAWRR